MIINNPQLPPLEGYVEVDADGVRMYRNIKTGETYLPGETPPSPEPDYTELLEALRILTGGADDELDDIISSNRT